jgi:hypothetical protein
LSIFTPSIYVQKYYTSLFHLKTYTKMRFAWVNELTGYQEKRTHDNHGHTLVGPQLEVGPELCGPVAVLVNAAAVDELRMGLVGRVWLLGNVPVSVKVVLDALEPVVKGHKLLCEV